MNVPTKQNNSTPTKTTIMIKSKTRQELATEYDVSRKTIYNWLKEAGMKLSSRLITPKELKIIYKTFGKPKKKSKKEKKNNSSGS